MLSSNAGIFVPIYNDNIDDFVPSFNCEVKESEVRNAPILSKSVQDAFAPPLRKGQHRVKRVKAV